MSNREIRCDIAIIGGGLGGVAAAMAAAERGLQVVVTEETDWLGGQLTSQAVPPDEHPWIEMFGSTRKYRRLREGIREYYRTWYPLSAQARAESYLNPGEGTVGPLCHEPRVAVAVIEGMLAPYLAAGLITVLYRHTPVSAETEGDRITAVTCAASDAERTVIEARFVLDATETGELLELAAVEHVTGAESTMQTGEPHAPDEAQPLNMQAFSVCFAVDHVAGEDHVIDKPEQYEHWRAYEPAIWPSPLLSLTAPDPRTLEPIARTFVPNRVVEGPIRADQSRDAGDKDLWVFRRIASRRQFLSGTLHSDITLVNWPMIDYWQGPVFGEGPVRAAEHLASAKQLSLSMLYWLQTEAPRPDGGTGWAGLRLRRDVTGTSDGLAKYPYIRESRRIQALYTIVEQDLSLEVRGERGSVRYHDSVGVGSYRIDLHPSTGGDTYIDVASCPFRIPLRALVPVRVINLLPAAKNIGTTHITNGCHRMHPTEWNIGEVAGSLAAYCLREAIEPEGATQGPHLATFQAELDRSGVERDWPTVRGY